MKTKNNGNNIKIVLSKSRYARAFREEESIWEIELNKLSQLLKEHLSAIKCINDSDDEELPLLSIGIFGAPGSGKSSLLETFVNMINSNESKHIESDVRHNYYSLPIITPDHESNDEQFLYSFIAAAMEADRKNRRSRDYQSSSSILSEVQQKFQELSEYLQVIDKTNHVSEDDHIGISMESLDRHESAILLRKHLCDFIDVLADNLKQKNGEHKKTVVLMPVDDADMSLRVLVSTLDICWRYLRHGRIVPVFTFTGRLAEELLRVNFEKKLSVEGLQKKPDALMQTSTPLMIMETMAIQYLAKVFPVRNRIQLDYSVSARILKYEYQSGKNDKLESELNHKENIVSKFLEKVSILLFGHSFPLGPLIRATLRMLPLRRQIQIVDAMVSSGVVELIDGKENVNIDKQEKPWGKKFELATWTLVNSHRDVLREFDLKIDDLRSWTPQGMRWVLLKSILNLSTQKRRELMENWSYRIEGRRSQIISLLAANVFRVRLDDEPTGDDPDIIRNTGDDLFKNLGRNLLVSQGAVWFLRLIIGFYLPQKLALMKTKDSACKKDENIKLETEDSVTGRWGFMSGPRHSLQNSLHLNAKGTLFPGLMFLEAEKYFDRLKENNETSLLIRIWSYYGCVGNSVWAAVSLWRGLGLIGRLLEIDLNYRMDYNQNIMRVIRESGKRNIPCDDSNQFQKSEIRKKLKQQKKELIQNYLKKHLEETLIAERLHEISLEEDSLDTTDFQEWNIIGDHEIEGLTCKIILWLERYRVNEKNDYIKFEPIPKESEDACKDDSRKWNACYIQRIHGDSIVSSFLQKIDKIYFKYQFGQWTMFQLLEEWCTILMEYWCEDTEEKKQSKVGNLLINCPILKPFCSAESLEYYQFENMEFDLDSKSQITPKSEIDVPIRQEKKKKSKVN